MSEGGDTNTPLMLCGHRATQLQQNGKCATCRRNHNREFGRPKTDGMCSQCRIRKPKARYTRCARCRGSEFDLCLCGAQKTKKSAMCKTCNWSSAVGASHGSWKGGKVQLKDGYVRVFAPDHPRRVNDRYVLEHILVMEEKLGRHLHPDERVHHVNKVRNDNRPANLELWSVGHPSGARTTDLLNWAYEIIERYEANGNNRGSDSVIDGRTQGSERGAA